MVFTLALGRLTSPEVSDFANAGHISLGVKVTEELPWPKEGSQMNWKEDPLFLHFQWTGGLPCPGRERDARGTGAARAPETVGGFPGIPREIQRMARSYRLSWDYSPASRNWVPSSISPPLPISLDVGSTSVVAGPALGEWGGFPMTATITLKRRRIHRTSATDFRRQSTLILGNTRRVRREHRFHRPDLRLGLATQVEKPG